MELRKKAYQPQSGGDGKITLLEEIKKHKVAYLMALPGILYYLIFRYGPMFGLVIAFQDYSPVLGIMKSEWVGLRHIIDFCNSVYFKRVVTNTLTISIMDLILGFPAPIILALLLNELKSNTCKKIVQTVTYIPYFVSTVIICGMITKFSMRNGVFNVVLGLFGIPSQNLLQNAGLFKWIYVLSNIWQYVGWNSIIYIAALGGIDPSLYEAAKIDGAGRLRQVFNVTIPGIVPTIVTLLIITMGNLLNVGYEKVLLLYNPTIYDSADIISTYVYRKGLIDVNYSYSSAVGFFNAIVNMVLIVSANYVSKKVTNMGLW